MIDPCPSKPVTESGQVMVDKTLIGDDKGPVADPNKIVDAAVDDAIDKALKRHKCARPCLRVIISKTTKPNALTVSYAGQDTKNSDIKYYSLSAEVHWKIRFQCIKIRGRLIRSGGSEFAKSLAATKVGGRGC